MSRREPVILSVDDSRDDAALLRAAMRESSLSCRLETVHSVDEAADYLLARGQRSDRHRHPFPDLVLLDIQMPSKDGFALLKWVRSRTEDWHRLPVIMLTTGHNYEEIKRAYDLGANSFLVKPADFDELARLLAHLVGYWVEYNKTFLSPGA